MASIAGLTLWQFNASTGEWASALFPAVAPARFVALSPDASRVLVSTARNVAAGAYANDGAPILTAQAGTEYRGVAFNPTLASPSRTPSVTPSNSASPSATATASATGSISQTGSVTSSPSAARSGGASPTGTATNTPSGTGTPSSSGTATGSPSPTASRTGTPTNTPSPTATVTGRGVLPAGGLVLVVIGDGAALIPNPTLDVTVPVTLNVSPIAGPRARPPRCSRASPCGRRPRAAGRTATARSTSPSTPAP